MTMSHTGELSGYFSSRPPNQPLASKLAVVVDQDLESRVANVVIQVRFIRSLSIVSWSLTRSSTST